jgi:hypothetical protein
MQFTIQRFRPARFNSNNHHDRKPYTLMDDGVWACTDRWAWLFERLRLAYRIVPTLPTNQVDPDNRIYTAARHMTRVVPDSWEARQWRDGSVLIPLSASFVSSLTELIHVRAVTGRPFKPASDLEAFPTPVLSQIETALTSFTGGGGAFVKLSSKSPKHNIDGKATPCTTVAQVLDLLSGDANLPTYIVKPEYLVIKPWREPTIEYRLFVCRGQLRAISTGNCYKDHPALFENGLLERHLTRIKEWWTRVQSEFPWPEACLDWDGEHGLIEINPCGDWGAAGSALFHWIDDAETVFDPPSGTDLVVVRVM